MMTNDKKTIKEITGLDIGKVYFENSETDELYDMTPILFDKSSGNFSYVAEKYARMLKKQYKELKISVKKSKRLWRML